MVVWHLAVQVKTLKTPKIWFLPLKLLLWDAVALMVDLVRVKHLIVQHWHFQMPNRSALNLECVFALKKNWPVTFAVPLDVTLISNLYGIPKVICLAQLNSTSEVRFPFMALNPIVGILENFIRYHSSNKPFEIEMTKSLILHVPSNEEKTF